jgi:NADPH:quinone reductase-like Zn-dependent oxidoreductase
MATPSPRVANWIPTDDIRDSGFQNYTICKTTLVSPLPDTLSFESGSALPLALSTASMGLYPSGRLELPLPQVTKPKPINKTILVWGGSSSTGSATIQLAVASGVNVVATASVKNHAFLRNLGVAKVLDYREESVVQDLVEAILETPGEFAGVLDAIGEEGTVRACMDVVSSLGGGRVVTNVPTPFEDTPNGVEVVGGEFLIS